MRDEKLYEEIKKLLQEYKSSYLIEDIEIEKLAALVFTVVNSPQDIRAVFYMGIVQIASKINKILKTQEEEIYKIINKKDDDKGGNILN
ncbi:MAG: hypothetical protein WC516_04430 [Patescibacteria group bacterium]|jgi:phosphotransferase system IIB component